MSMRATDKVAGVREHAVVALKRLQDLSNPEDGVTQLLLCTLHTDSSKCAAAGAGAVCCPFRSRSRSRNRPGTSALR